MTEIYSDNSLKNFTNQKNYKCKINYYYYRHGRYYSCAL